jgi:hypothetical protein
MICIDQSDGTLFPGLCAACVENYGMQTGDLVLLKRPPEECEAEVQFLMPEIDAIRVRDRASRVHDVGELVGLREDQVAAAQTWPPGRPHRPGRPNLPNSLARAQTLRANSSARHRSRFTTGPSPRRSRAA